MIQMLLFRIKRSIEAWKRSIMSQNSRCMSQEKKLKILQIRLSENSSEKEEISERGDRGKQMPEDAGLLEWK